MDSIYIQGLFGRFTYDIKLNKEGLTIITGPNGYGKSTILKCIEYLSNGLLGMAKLMKIDFERIVIAFSNRQFVIINDSNNVNFDGIEMSKMEINKIFNFNYNKRAFFDMEGEILFDRKMEQYILLEDAIDKMYNNEDYTVEIKKIYQQMSIFEDKNIFSDLSVKLAELKKMIGEIYFVKEQRLLKENHRSRENRERNKPQVINVVEELPKNFKMKITEISSKYSEISSSLDSSYPTRLFENKKIITEEEYQIKNEELKNRHEKLHKYDLAPPLNSKLSYNSDFAKALKVYFDDFNQKYKIYEPFIQELDLFTEIINNRLNFKQIKITKEDGLVILDNEVEDKKLDISQLSSGEKQELVLFYELLFETPNNTLLLIDEPEISLHIAWQKMFMDDLMKITKYKQLNVIVATHSPEMLNNHWEKQVDLGQLYHEFNKR